MIDPGRLHVITDTSIQSRFDAVDLAVRAAEGGADVIQFREKRPGVPLRATIDRLREALADFDVRLVVNDRVDLAAAYGAGVHVGSGDLDPFAARVQLGEAALIGRTIHDADQARAWARAPVDYFGVGPFAATTHAAVRRRPLGRRGLSRLAGLLPRPVIAVGGIDGTNAIDAIEAGAHGVAVLGTVACASDPAAATARLRRRMREATEREGALP